MNNYNNNAWLGRMQIIKPKKGEKIGIPYSPWHHLAIVDNIVLLYVWDTREITDAYKIGDLRSDFDTMKIVDNGKSLFYGKNTSERAKRSVKALLDKYPELPITDVSTVIDLDKLRSDAKEALESLADIDMQEDAAIVFIDKTMALPDNLYMYKQMPTFNPTKIKLADNNAYNGRAKYFAILARKAVLDNIKQLNNDTAL